MTAAPSLGFVVNPIAGMGGPVGLHGTDGSALGSARRRGAHPVAPERAGRALRRLADSVPRLRVYTVAGEMGADYLPADFPRDVVALPAPSDPTTADDTRAAVRWLVDAGVTLLLFVGGDGTARDVAAAAGPTVPLLGVPAGVKMHSGVFAAGPEVAGETAAKFLNDPIRTGTRMAEVVDLTDDAGVHLLAVARVPAVRSALIPAKAVARTDDDAVLAALGREVAGETAPGVLCLLGPGTTVAHVHRAWDLPASVLGVDVVCDGRLVAADAGESQLLTLLAAHPEARVVLGVVGGQGFLLGRGNQQISGAVLGAVGLDHLEVLAAPSKIAGLTEPVLHVDLDDAAVTARLAGYRRVRTGSRRSTVLWVASTPRPASTTRTG